jgi:hypothetical protein
VCIRKLELVETVLESYGKYVINFQKRTLSNILFNYIEDMNNKIARYKFGNGDIVGLFEYSDKVQ